MREHGGGAGGGGGGNKFRKRYLYTVERKIYKEKGKDK